MTTRPWDWFKAAFDFHTGKLHQCVVPGLRKGDAQSGAIGSPCLLFKRSPIAATPRLIRNELENLHNLGAPPRGC